MEVANVPLSPMASFQNQPQMLHYEQSSTQPRTEQKKQPKRIDEISVLANGNVMKHQKSRQRRILSCVHCHSKKIKCSRDHPECQNCQKLKIECKYFINERVSKGRHRRPSARKTSIPKLLELATLDSDSSVPSLKQPETMIRKESLMSENSSGNGSITSPDLSELKREPHNGNGIHHMDTSNDMSVKPEPMMNSNDLPMNYHVMGGAFSPNVSSPGGKFSFHKTPNAFFPSNMASPSSNMLQAPIANLASNNITNNFFNTNYATSNSVPSTVGPDDQFSFNLSSFTFAPATENMINRAQKNPIAQNSFGKENDSDKRLELKLFSGIAELSSTNLNGLIKSQTTNFVDGPTPPGYPLTSNISTSTQSIKNSQPMNLGLHNSLNAYPSNPETTINYLYGTNTYYENDNLLSDLITHLPNSRERSYECIDRYVNSVHILLPILVNLPEFLKQHDIFWEHFDPYRTMSPTSSSSSSSSKHIKDFNFLQFYTLYFPVLYASTISEFEEYDNLLLNQDINKYLKGFNKICQYYNYPHGIKTIPILLGNVIIQSTSPNPSTMEMSQIIRYAKFLQLHKDPLISLRISDWKVVKFRRMLWWVIFGLDAVSSHNFCLPPVCKFDDFNVLLPEEEDPVFDEAGNLVKKRLNVTVLALTVKFKYDRILSELVYHLHHGLATNITTEEINEIKLMIVNLFHYIHKSIIKMNNFYKANPPTTVPEMNLVNFIKNHSWSFVDRALMLLHKKILLRDPEKNPGLGDPIQDSYELSSKQTQNGILSLSQFEDTFGRIQEANIIKNFDNSSISQLKFNQNELFAYENLHNNLIPSILHNLNDFLKYNDFIKFGRFNWYVKRTIPLDSIILLFVIICVKFKYEFMTPTELVTYVKLINKALFILNRKYFKNEKYKRMLSLTNLTWEYILKKHNVVRRISQTGEKKASSLVHFFDHQVSGFMNMSELFSIMDVPQPALINNGVNFGSIKLDETPMQIDHQRWEAEDSEFESPEGKLIRPDSPPSQLQQQLEERREDEDEQGYKLKVMQLSEKIYYDLRNNFVDINDYCTFYSSLENVLHELMDYINSDLRH
ncbi:hypothetical protein PUMCH_003488 [Australozyma saopauloensis]|uniref:Zn(2)-C6 fungal-type domain-containing protein n=1 Tax=Australozyma saopauloensis TaxID=291208 RepID=A0AAX4HCA1_9ASCO|nr:hypothetical protein PUMCH_003488 [[Candida] saopauloensis]